MEFLILLFGALALGAYVQERVVPDVRRRWARWQQQRKADAAAAKLAAMMADDKARIYATMSELADCVGAVKGKYYDVTQGNAVLTTCGGCGNSYYMTHPQALCSKCRGAR